MSGVSATTSFRRSRDSCSPRGTSFERFANSEPPPPPAAPVNETTSCTVAPTIIASARSDCLAVSRSVRTCWRRLRASSFTPSSAPTAAAASRTRAAASFRVSSSTTRVFLSSAAVASSSAPRAAASSFSAK